MKSEIRTVAASGRKRRPGSSPDSWRRCISKG